MDASQLINDLGGTAKVARLCEVKMAAVSQWRRDGIPNARLMFLRLARPDIFKMAESAATASSARQHISQHQEPLERAT